MCVLLSLILISTTPYLFRWQYKLHQQLALVSRKLKTVHTEVGVFGNMVLRRIFGPKRDEVTGEWRKLHNEELNGLHSSPNIVRVIKSRRMRWAGHVQGRGEVHTRFWWGNLRERDHLEDPGVDGRIILRWLFQKWVWWHGLDRSGSGQGQVASTCECDNEPSGSIKCREFLD